MSYFEQDGRLSSRGSSPMDRTPSPMSSINASSEGQDEIRSVRSFSTSQNQSQTLAQRRGLSPQTNVDSAMKAHFNQPRKLSMVPASPMVFSSRPMSTLLKPVVYAARSALQLAQEEQDKRYFRSRRLKPDHVMEKPWKDTKDPREKWVTIIPLIGMGLGLAAAAALVIQGLFTVQHHKYKLVLDERWDTFNTAVWTKESNVGGFGNGEFIQTTPTDENVFIQNGKLHIKPTLQDSNLIEQNNTLQLGTSCTGSLFYECNAVTNTTNGTVIPPVKSGRINTMKGAKIKYGRIEVAATLPLGDWLWPAIWMLPVNDTYGPWPRSGEIDIMESRGNNWTYAQGGNDIISSALHWGPDQRTDAWWQTNVKKEALHTTFAAKEHVFGLEWSEKYLFTYLDNRLAQVLYTPFSKPLWSRGRFPTSDQNGSIILNPWIGGGPSTPFDQEFYLILNVAVGGTNGWFKDGKSGKPWVDTSDSAAKEFWNGKNQWLPTWKEGAEMVVSSVKMWQQLD